MCLSLVDGLMMNMVFPWKNPWWNPWFLRRLLPQEIKMSPEKGPFRKENCLPTILFKGL